jgi:predicted acetyltransferase
MDVSMSNFTFRPLANDDDAQQIKTLDAQCFIGSESDGSTYVEHVGTENFRLLCQSDQIIGGLAILPMGQWWGGQRVSMAGIASVGILPEHRGGGSAIFMMRSAVQEMYHSGVAASVLYPATQRLYRKAGYEQGGTHCAWTIRTDQIGGIGRSLPITPMTPDPKILMSTYATYAAQHNGLGDRHRSIWRQKLHQRDDQPLYGYWIGAPDHPQGYIVFTQHRDKGEGILTIRDWTATTVEAAQTLWSFLHGHRSQIDRIRWYSGAFDPMLPLLPEQSAHMTDIDHWMLRIINVPLALEQRGYPLHVAGELHFRVEDTVIDANSTSFVLTVQNGKGTVKPGGRGDLTLSVGALASLYAGLHSPQYLKWLGWLEGADDQVAIAAPLFAGPPSWIPDFF